MNKSKSKVKRVKLTKIEEAILKLAEHIELCPYNNYKAGTEILNILGYEP